MLRVLDIVVKLKDNIVEPGTDNGKGDEPNHEIIHVIRLQAEFPAPFRAVEHTENKAQTDDDTVEVDVLAEHGKVGRGIYSQIPQHGEGDGGIPLYCLYKDWEHDYTALASIMDRARRSGARLSVMKSSHSPRLMLSSTGILSKAQ